LLIVTAEAKTSGGETGCARYTYRVRMSADAERALVAWSLSRLALIV
jgi:hypothetical protein